LQRYGSIQGRLSNIVRIFAKNAYVELEKIGNEIKSELGFDDSEQDLGFRIIHYSRRTSRRGAITMVRFAAIATLFSTLRLRWLMLAKKRVFLTEILLLEGFPLIPKKCCCA